MRRGRALAGSALFLVIAPGCVAGLVPWWITRWRVAGALPPALRVAGALLLAAGAAVILPAFWRFAVEGLGTPAPVAPTARLVVGGLYARVRNPMYLAVTSAVAGQALLLGSPALALYGAAALACMVAFVRLYEEPTLLRRYGDAYAAYRRAVPGWWPRLTPPSSTGPRDRRPAPPP
jgi:protein-S-isoprenylcysteine O-methyltransferase Ste14